MNYARPFWAAERTEQLRQLFEKGLLTAEISRLMGLTKNAVIGKLNRMGCVRGHPWDKAWAPRVATHYPIDDLLDREKVSRRRCCRWPHGHPDEPHFQFCGAWVENFLPYCSEHAALAYLTPPSSQE